MVPIEAFRLYYLSRTLSSADPTFDIVPFILLTQVEQHYSLIAATIPCLRPFLKAANTGLLDVNPTQVENCGSYLNSGGSASHTSYAMRSIDRASRAPSSRTNHHRPSKILTTATTTTIPEPVSPGTREAINIATGFKAFDAHHAGIELPSPQTTTTTATTPSSPPHTLDAIAIAPMSASPTVAKHMLAAAAAPSTTQPSVTARAAPASPPLPDDSSFTSDGSEKMIIRKETALHVRYSPIVGAERRWRGDAELAGVPMGLDLERVDTAGSIPIGVAVDAPPWRREGREDCRVGAWLEEATPPREEGRGTEKGWDRRRR